MNFKKDEYIVVLDYDGSNTKSFPKNHCFKQRETNDWLRVYADCNNGWENGWNKLDPNLPGFKWRYATDDEAARYDRTLGPFYIIPKAVNAENNAYPNAYPIY